ncbi:MAG: MXAN_2562 family outer membrane beta-barrel protein [Deltaproteobacteria bacterium]|jgi:hypothetical protein
MNAWVLVLLVAQTPKAEAERPFVPPTLVSTTVGVKLGPYQADIDSEFGSATPLGDLFKDDTGIYVVPQVRLLRDFGFFGLGVSVSVGYTQQSTKAFVDDGDETTPSSGTELSGGETSVRVIPVAALGVVRFRGVMEWIGLPLIPYVEAGPAYAFWRIGKGDGSAAASGGSLGWTVNAGVALRIDSFEPFASKALRDQFGVQGTELTFEWSHLSADGFGLQDVLRVGDSTWTAGLAIGF